MQQISVAWLVLTIVLSAYVCFRWSASTWYDALLKFGFLAISVFGVILFYHRVLMGLPL